MPEKDPMTWAAGWAALPDPIRAAIVGALVALFNAAGTFRSSR